MPVPRASQVVRGHAPAHRIAPAQQRGGDDIDIPAAGAGPARRAPCGSARAARLSMPSVAPTWADTPFPLLPSNSASLLEGRSPPPYPALR